jgi:hypothetical protein
MRPRRPPARNNEISRPGDAGRARPNSLFAMLRDERADVNMYRTIAPRSLFV